MFKDATLPDSPSAISSPGSGAGVLPCSSPAGQTTGLFGPAPVPARISLTSDAEHALLAIETSGLKCEGSSASERLMCSLVNRLTIRLNGMIGRPLIWRFSVTPAGRSWFQLVPSGRSTSANGCTLLPTPRHAMKTDGIAWGRCKRGEHRSNLEEVLGCMWLADGGKHLVGGGVDPRLVGAMMGYPLRWLVSATQSFRKSRRSSSEPIASVPTPPNPPAASQDAPGTTI